MVGRYCTGLLMGFSVCSVYVGYEKADCCALRKASAANRWAAFKDAFWGLAMPKLYYPGRNFTEDLHATEAAAVAAVYGLKSACSFTGH